MRQLVAGASSAGSGVALVLVGDIEAQTTWETSRTNSSLQRLKGNQCLESPRNRGFWQINHYRYL